MTPVPGARGRAPEFRYGPLYSGASRACGGIGRRARLRALWAVWPVGVRVSLGALGTPLRGVFAFRGWRAAALAAFSVVRWESATRRSRPVAAPRPARTDPSRSWRR